MERKVAVEINEYITVLTFIPWVLFIILSLGNNLNKKEYTEFSFEYLKKNVLKIFRLDTLFLIIVFYYFASFDVEFVPKYLFVVICIYLFVNGFYDKKAPLKKNYFKNNVIAFILLLIVISFPFIYFINTNNLVMTYKIMLIYIFIQYIIVMVVSYVNRWIRRLIKGTS